MHNIRNKKKSILQLAASITNIGFLTAAIATVFLPNHTRADESPYRYALIRIPGFGGIADRAFAVNDLGNVVGSSFTKNGVHHPFYWDGEMTIDLGTFGGSEWHAGTAFDINNHNVIVGFAEDENVVAQPFVYRNEKLINLGEGVFWGGLAWAINDAGQIGGKGHYIDGPCCRPILWDGTEIVNLPSISSEGGEVRAINTQGYMVGYVEDETGADHAAAWSDGKLVQLPGFLDDDPRSDATDVNDQNIAVGQAGGIPFQWDLRAAVWDEDGNVHKLPRADHMVKNYAPFAAAINESNQIVGPSILEYDGEFRGYIFTLKGGAKILDRLVPPNSGVRITYPADINEHGQIVSHGYFERNRLKRDRSFLLTPVNPEIDLQFPDGPLRADAINTLTIIDAEPGATIRFYYGKRGGGRRIPGCDALAAMTQINDPVLFGEAIADADGNAELKIYIPKQAAAHKGFLIQAVDFGNCEESQLRLKKVE